MEMQENIYHLNCSTEESNLLSIALTRAAKFYTHSQYLMPDGNVLEQSIEGGNKHLLIFRTDSSKPIQKVEPAYVKEIVRMLGGKLVVSQTKPNPSDVLSSLLEDKLHNELKQQG